MRTIQPPQNRNPRRAACLSLAILLASLCPAHRAAAQATENVLYEFGAPNSGADPQGPLVFDAAGNLYGTTQSGGAYGWGTVFQLSPGPGGWTQTELYSFTSGKDGGAPYAGLAIDAAGNLYGTTVLGGDLGGVNCYVEGGCGTVFELSRDSGGKWTETVLYAFGGGRDGNAPEAAVTLDSQGNIYGTTTNGGSQTSYGYGTVFRLTNTAGVWKESVLHRFTDGTDGGYPVSSVTVDAAGNVYGTTAGGGNEACNPPHGCGLVFKLSPNANGSWRETVLHSFLGGKDGSGPLAGLIFDAAGNLYGTTNAGGGAATCPDALSPGCGMVFELSPAQSGWKETVLHAFTGGKDGGSPWAPLTWDAAGNLYGNTYIGGSKRLRHFLFQLRRSLPTLTRQERRMAGNRPSHLHRRQRRSRSRHRSDSRSRRQSLRGYDHRRH